MPYSWITPVTSWTSGSYYNFSDFNRVENNIAYLQEYLVSLGYAVPAVTVITARTNTSYDQVSSINRIESNLNTIRNNFYTPTAWSPTITWTAQTKFTDTIANRWENSALQLYTMAITVPQSYRYSGIGAAGEELLPQV